MFDHLVGLLLALQPIKDVVGNLFPSQIPLTTEHNAVALLWPQRKLLPHQVAHQQLADVLPPRQPVHHLHPKNLHCLAVLLRAGQFHPQQKVGALSPLGQHWALDQEVPFQSGIGGGSVEVDLSVPCHADQLPNGPHLGQLGLGVVPDPDGEHQWVVIDLAIFNFQLQVDPPFGGHLPVHPQADGLFEHGDLGLELYLWLVHLGRLDVVAEQEPEGGALEESRRQGQIARFLRNE